MKNTFVVSLLLLLFAVFASTGLAGGSKSKSGSSNYLIQAPHTEQDCQNVLDEMTKSNGFLSKCYWGCMSGDHTAYAIVNAKSEEAARNMLPSDVRGKAKIMKVDKFTTQQIASFHKHQ